MKQEEVMEQVRKDIRVTFCMNSLCYADCGFRNSDCLQVKTFMSQILSILEVPDPNQSLPECDYGEKEGYDKTSKLRGQAIQALTQLNMRDKENWVKVVKK